MARTHPDLPWCRYADDGLVHCRTEQEAETIKVELQARLAECWLEMHPTKTKIVYCQDGNRKGKYPNSNSTSSDTAFGRDCVQRPERQTVLWIQPSGQLFGAESHADDDRELDFLHQTQLSLVDIARRVNPLLRGWIEYYGRYAPSALASLLRYINHMLRAWVMRKFKRFAAHKIRAVAF